MSVLRRDDVSVDGNIGFREEVSEGGELGVGFGIGTGLSDFGRRLHSDGTAIADGEERGLSMGFEFGKKRVERKEGRVD